MSGLASSWLYSGTRSVLGILISCQEAFSDHPDAAMVREVLGRRPEEGDAMDEEEEEEGDSDSEDDSSEPEETLSTRNTFAALLDDSS